MRSLPPVLEIALSAFAEDYGRKPVGECDGRTCRSLGEGRCFGGFRRRNEGYRKYKRVEASFFTHLVSQQRCGVGVNDMGLRIDDNTVVLTGT